MLRCFKPREKTARIPYQALSEKFEEGDIVYGLSIDRTPAVNALDRRKFPSRKNGKDNILTQNPLTDAVFGVTVTPGKYRSDEEIKAQLYDYQRGIGFKKFTTNYSSLKKLDYLELPEKDRANRLWKRTSKAGLVYQIFNMDKKVHFCVENLHTAIDKIAKKEGIEGNSVTASEIRFLFRHRNQPQVSKNLKIYNKDKEISIDKFFSHPFWSLYTPSQTHF